MFRWFLLGERSLLRAARPGVTLEPLALTPIRLPRFGNSTCREL